MTRVEYAPPFLRRLKNLRKKYPHIRNDLEPVLEQLQQGATPGDQIQGIGYPVYKLHLKNTDIPKGKSGGYRVIYYLRTASVIILITIYAKTEQIDISAGEIKALIEEYNRLNPPP